MRRSNPTQEAFRGFFFLPWANSWLEAKGGRKLIIANFFFYALGSDPRQKSLMGLYRTLLYQILTTSPGLMQNLLPDQWTKALSQPKIHSAYEILDDDIKRAYERLSKQHDGNSLGGYCFSFFIDGLDEYQASTSVDRREMVRCLTDLANSASGSFKICVSSRIENPFMDMFSEDTRFYLHDLTKSDMEEYVQGNLHHVGTQEERLQLASSITKKAEGVFLWVVLVVQKIRKLSDDGARFSRLLGEIESLPTELNELFQRILDALGTEDRRLVSHTVSLLHFLGTIPEAKKMHLWLNLGDFYFLEDYEADLRFAEGAQFPRQGSETFKNIVIRARRQLRGVCRGLVEADKANDLGFTHRSVGDFFKQEKVRIEMHDESFNNIEALSQLKLASVKQYWWDIEQQNGNKDDEGKKAEEEILNRHSVLVACLVEQRRSQQLDTPPFSFLECLDTIPQLSVSTTVSRAIASHKTAFHISPSWRNYKGTRPYCHYEICHTTRVRHTVSDPDFEGGRRSESTEDQFNTENPAVLRRYVYEEVENIEEYSRAVISPLFTELCSGRLEYPRWRIAHIHDMPLESDNLAMLVYCAIGTAIGRVFWKLSSTTSAGEDDDNNDDDYDDDDGDRDSLIVAGVSFLRHLFEHQIVSPNLLTHLAFGAEFGFIRIAAGNQRLSIWQHFLCWWVTVAAAFGDFESEGDTGSDHELSNDSSEQSETSFVLETFIRNGADLQLALKIEDREEESPGDFDDIWLAYTLEMVPDGGESLELDVVVNLETRMDLSTYPYGLWQRNLELYHDYRPRQPLPNSPLSVRDWIDRSRLPNKDVLLRLIDEKLGVTEVDDVPTSDPSQDESEDEQPEDDAVS